MGTADERRAKLNIEMGERREQIRRLNQELAAAEKHLAEERERVRSTRDLKRLQELTADLEAQRLERFARVLEVEARRRLKLRADLPPVVGRAAAGDLALGYDVKRTAVRAPYVMPVHFGGLREQYSGVALNVSLGGMMVATCDPPPLNHRFVVEFDLDFKEFPVRAPVESVWVRPDGGPDRAGRVLWVMGVQFAGLTSWDNERVAEFCNTYAEVVGVDPIRK